jgi:PAS domain S-box-containing protein
MKADNRAGFALPSRFWVPYFILVAGLILTAASAWYVNGATKASARQRFAIAVEQTIDAIEERFRADISLLRGTRRLFGVDARVSRQQFREYIDSLYLRARYPGIQGIGFAQRAMPGDRERLIASMRGEGFPAFRIWPEQSGELYPILYLEPSDTRNRAAIGYNMFADPVRRAAMIEARDTGQPAASGKVTLVQEIDTHKQAGFLIYMPIYWGGIIPFSKEERIATIRGFVYSPFRADDLFWGILGAQQSPSDIIFRVFDGAEQREDRLLHDSAYDSQQWSYRSELTATRTIDVAGRRWTIVFAADPGSAASPFFQPAVLIGAMGGAISLLLFTINRVQSSAYQAAARHTDELRISQRAALQSEARKQAMFELALDCVITMDHEGNVVEFNPAAEKTFGYRNAEVVGKALAELIIPASLRERHRRGLKRYLATGESDIIGRRIEITGMRADGSEFPVELAITRLDLDGQPLFTAYLRDITSEKRAEERLRQVIESAPGAMVMVNAVGEIVLVNSQTEKVFGYSREELIGQSIELLVPERLRAHHSEYRHDFLRQPQARPMGEGRDLFARRRDGSEFPVEIGLNPIETEEGTMVLSTIVDITARKQAEEAIKSSLREKDVMLKEIHHRVKNNLQIISSLLDLQSGTVNDPRVLQSFQESQHRIRSMALIHEKLYQSADLAEVDFADYVRSLIAYLMRAYRISDATVSLKLDAEPVRLRIDTAIPCGLILNELVSNSLKHAFPNGRRGTITVVVRPEADGRASLRVSDNGVGLPPRADWWAGPSLGLRLVHTLTQQLRGTMDVETAPGASFHLNFPLT